MPAVSKSQARYMFAHKDDKGPLGKVAREYTSAQTPGSIKRLPERKAKKKEPASFGSLSP